MSAGVISVVKDLLVVAEFDDEMPESRELVVVEGLDTLLLVDSLQPGNQALCLNIHSDRRLQKGMSVRRTGKSIEIPTGDEMIGRVVDALGLPIDGQPPVDGENIKRRNIFINPDGGGSFSARKPEILETGVKVID